MNIRDMIPLEATRHCKRQCEYKRFEVFCGLLKEGDRVLDVGCGIGSYSSNPLSWLPIEVTAIDSDAKTIEYARVRNVRKNLEFVVADGETYKSDKQFDLIICSHVIEHMKEPRLLLNNMKTLLKDDGILYLGLPNGFGIFEMQNMVPRLLSKSEWGSGVVSKFINGKVKDTLNVESQHVQFFTVRRVKRLLADCGWQIIRQINDEFMGGIVFDRLLPKFPVLARWNVSVVDYLPAQLASGWIFICKRNEDVLAKTKIA